MTPIRQLTADLPVDERILTLAGIRTPILEGGDGPPLVLLHGPGGYAAQWRQVLPALVARWRVVAPDLPGHGESQAGAGALDAPRVLSWLEELVAATCPAAPTFAGHLVGGAIAARFAARAPRRVARLVLVDSFGLAPFDPAPAFARALTRFLGAPGGPSHDELWRLCSYDLDRLVAAFGERWASFAAVNVELTRRPSVRAAVNALMETFAYPAIPAAELDAIRAPVTLIWGRHDLGTPLAVAEAASARHRWPLRVIDDAADAPMMDRPAEFVAALEARS